MAKQKISERMKDPDFMKRMRKAAKCTILEQQEHANPDGLTLDPEQPQPKKKLTPRTL